MKQMDVIFGELQLYYDGTAFKKAVTRKQPYGMEATEIANRLSIARNNASAILNKLVDEEKIVKITGRPVLFLPRQPLEETLKRTLEQSEFTYEELRRLLIAAQDPFQDLVGNTGTLKTVIEQAKAAIMYPPNGLNTVVVGRSGSGVTHFVETMYEFARVQKDMTPEEYPYQYINCADYNNYRQVLYRLFGSEDQEDAKKGLLKKADGGMLFIDNAYLLPKEAWERLYQFMSEGEYHRIDDLRKTIQARVLIVVSYLNNYILDDIQLRRFPITIQLPELAEWNVDERISLIENYFSIEVGRVMRPLKVASEVVRALCIYDCPGNLSQLEADIKKICARAFLEQLHCENELRIEFSYLPSYIKNFVISGKKINSHYKEYLKAFDNNLIIEADHDQKVHVLAQNSIYAEALNISEKMNKKGLQREKIDRAVKKYVEDYINHYLARFDDSLLAKKELYHFLDREIVDFTVSVAEEASKQLKRNMNNNLVYVLAFHINYLILRNKVNGGEEKAGYPFSVNVNSEEYAAAQMITRRISKHFETDISDQEIGFIALLLEGEGSLSKKDEKANILIVAYGEKTATSMANVANELMKTNIVYGIDMPLELEMSDIYREVLSIAKALRNEVGILLMVDMDSLAQIGRQVAEETGIAIKSVERVSTSYVLEAVRRILYKNETLEEIQAGIMELQTLPYYANGEVIQRPFCIITTCSTGMGTSIMLQKKVEEQLAGKKITTIKVISIGYTDIKARSAKYEEIRRKYEIIACVGNINPHITDAFFDLTSVVRKNKNYLFDEFLDSYADVCKNDSYAELESILNDNIYYFNVKRSLPYFQEFFDSISKAGYVFSNDAILKCSLHISYMLERLILKQMAIFSENVKDYIKKNRELYNMLHTSLRSFEKAFNIDITEDEVCFLCEVFNNIEQL